MSVGKAVGVAAVVLVLVAIPWSRNPPAEPWVEGLRPRYVEFCPEKNAGDTDRYRLCQRFFQSAFKPDTLPEAAIFLRKRLDDLIPSYRQEALSAFAWYEYTVYGVLLAGFLAIAGTAIVPALVSKATIFTATGATLLAALSAFGFNAQFKTNFVAYRELTSLRDEIDLQLVAAAQNGTRVPDAFVTTATASYKSIVNTHAASFGASFSTPSLIAAR